MQFVYKIDKIYFEQRFMDFCGLPYPGHPKGCPNFNKGKSGCPYTTPLIDKVIDITKSIYLIGIDFDLEEHTQKMKVKHPSWTDRQCKNVLYWQPHHKKLLKFEIDIFTCDLNKDKLFVTIKPEAYGVNMCATVRQVGIKLDWHYPLKHVWRIALIGELK